MTQYIRGIIGLVLSLLMLVMVGCESNNGNDVAKYGYVQFKLIKSGSEAQSATRLTDELEYLSEAHKIKVVMQHDGSTITQTLQLNAYNDHTAAWGMRSDKLRLLTGRYDIIGYYLYNNLDQELLVGDASGDFTVEHGGLVVKPVEVNVVKRGWVQFNLQKEFTRAEGDYQFGDIRSVDISVKNKFTQQITTFKRLPVSHVEEFRNESADESLYPEQNAMMSYAVCDTLLNLVAGNYIITDYTTYSDVRATARLETASVSAHDVNFTIEDNKATENVNLPVLLSTTAEHIKDYIALKEIWMAMDGENWSFHGEEYVAGANWNFNKDIDMWGEQPGVTLDGDGRVAMLNISGFGARGVVPDAIGQLTKLKTLYLGNHNEMLGGFSNTTRTNNDHERIDAMDYYHKCVKRDARENLSAELKEVINRDPEQRPILSSPHIEPMDMSFGELTSHISGISRAVMRLTELEQLFIANCPITAEDFFVDVKPDSEFYAERDKWSWSKFNMLTDIEIYNCPNLTRLPLEMLAELPAMQSLNVSVNKSISGEQLKADWEALIDSPAGSTLQILYLGYNNLEETPSYDYMKRMVKLGLLDCTNNRLRAVHPFGKEVTPAKIYFDFNQIERIYAAEDGYFCGVSQLEEFSARDNNLTVLPDIFTARSIYVMGSINFSNNRISTIENGDSWRGINASTLNLSNNRFETLPPVIIGSSSAIEVLMLSGNGIRHIEEGALKGKNSAVLSTIDLSFNRLSEIPYDDFSANNIPYLYGIDLSSNAFAAFPFAPLTIESLTVMSIRQQRDDEGNRTLREWPTGLHKCPRMSAFYIGSNDLREVNDVISPYILLFEIKDNPNISIDLSGVCSYIKAGYYELIYDSTQDIRGCDALNLD